MAIPQDIDPQVVQLCQEADWVWDNDRRAFVEARQPDRESLSEYRSRSQRSICYEELRDHNLAGATDAAKHLAGLAWLRKSLGLDE